MQDFEQYTRFDLRISLLSQEKYLQLDGNNVKCYVFSSTCIEVSDTAKRKLLGKFWALGDFIVYSARVPFTIKCSMSVCLAIQCICDFWQPGTK